MPYSKPELSTQVREARYFYLHQRRLSGAGLVAVCGGRESCAPDYRIDRPTFPYFGVEWVERGQGELWLRGRRHALRPATVFCYGPGVPCRIATDPEHPLVKGFLDITGPEAETLLAQVRLRPGHCVRVTSPVELAELFDGMYREATRHGREAHALVAAYVRLFLLKVQAGRAPDRPVSTARQETFLRSRQFLLEHYRRHPTVEAAAKALGLTPSYLCRLFREHGEASPYQFLLRLRMHEALERLLLSGGQVKQTSFACGFRDPSHFARLFRQVHGVSPRELVARTQRTGPRGG